MHYSYLIPDWFFGFDLGMEVLFALVAFSVAIVAFKINSVTKEKKIRLFGVAFLLIGISYVILAALNFWFVTIATEGFKIVNISDVQVIGVISLYAFMILFVSGLVTLVYITCDSNKGKTYYVIFGLSLMVIAASLYKLVTFRILAAFLFSFIAFHYFEEFLKNKNKRAFWTLMAFVFLFMGSVNFILSPIFYWSYIIGHLFELSAYMIILTILIKSVKK